MEENVALDSTKQRKFVKSIKGIKKLIKKDENVKPEDASPKPKTEKQKRKRPDRGLVYLSHIPHGFYEHEMTQYFKQFGMVTNVRVIRSKRTGNSKGFAFVEFKEPAVAEIVAETMNNYLMGKRLIKAAYVPPEKQRRKAMRKRWNPMNNPGRDARLKMKKAFNENKDDKGDLKRARKILSNINKTKKKLSEKGINYDFFMPVDVPEALKDLLKSKEVDENKIIEKTNKNEKKSKKDKKQNVEGKDTKELLKEITLAKDGKLKSEKNKVVKKNVQEPVVKSEMKKSENKKVEPVVNKKEQKKKQQILKDAGVNPAENYIKVQEGSEDSDSSLEFDSDEYEKMLEDDGSDIDSDDDSEDDGDDDEDTDDAGSGDDDSNESKEEDEEDRIPQSKKSKGKPMPIVAKPQKQNNKQKGQAPEQAKRKAQQKIPVAAKKPKFEKQNQQPIKKQFKKKKGFIVNK